MRLFRASELTVPPPTLEPDETILTDVRALIKLAERQVVEAGL